MCNVASERCWCMEYPAVLVVDSKLSGCLCEPCLKDRINAKIQEYVVGITPENAEGNSAKDLYKNLPLKEEIDYYIENGLYVFTTWFHLKRGACCKNGCRHCPYGYKK